MSSGNPKSIGNLVLRNIYHVRKLFCGRLAFVFLFEFSERLVNLVQGAHLIQRQSHNTALLGKRLKNGLANPPYCIRNKLKASGLIEFLRSLYKSEVALVDKVRKTEPLILILLGYRYHETKIGSGKFFKSFLIALSDTLGKFHLFLR